MLLSHRYRFIYLKTKKTAGTSVEMALEQFARPEDAASDGPRRELAGETEAGIIGVGLRRTAQGEQKWFSHMPARRVKAQLPTEVWESYTKIANVRNPWDKVVSFFHMQFPRVKARPKPVIFKRFRRWVQETEKLGQDINVYCIRGEPVIDEFIRYDRIEEDFRAVCDKLGLPKVDLPVANMNFRGTEKRIPYQDYYDEASREVVREVFARDIERMGWTFEGETASAAR